MECKKCHARLFFVGLLWEDYHNGTNLLFLGFSKTTILYECKAKKKTTGFET